MHCTKRDAPVETIFIYFFNMVYCVCAWAVYFLSNYFFVPKKQKSEEEDKASIIKTDTKQMNLKVHLQ